MKRSVKDWILVLVLLLDEVAALALVLLILWIFRIRVPIWFILVIVPLLGIFIFITHKVIVPSFHKKKVTGSEGMIGLEGVVIEPLAPRGVVMVEGEYWKARAVDGDISVDEEVEILGLNRLILEVKCKNR